MRNPAMHPGKRVMQRMRERLKQLEKKGIVDKRQRRQKVSAAEQEFWERRASEWRQHTIKTGGSKGFSLQTDRSINKAVKLSEKMENAKTSVERRKIIREISGLRVPSSKVIERLPIKTRIKIQGTVLGLAEILEGHAQNNKLPAKERIESVRAIAGIYGLMAAEPLIGLLERNPKNHIARAEIQRILSKNISSNNISTVKERLLKSRNTDLKTTGIKILANMPSVFAISTLAESMKGRIQKRQRREPSTAEREAMLREMFEQIRKEGSSSLRKLSFNITEQMQRGLYGGYDMNAQIFYEGMTAKAIGQWIEKFGKKANVDKQFYKGLRQSLLERLNTMTEARKAGINTDYAAAKIKEAIKIIEKTT